MKALRIYTGADNESHFEDIDIPMDIPRPVGVTSKYHDVSKLTFITYDANSVYDFHPAPRRQIVITLDGVGEIEIGDGTRRRINPGNILFAEDTTGHGHISRVLGKPRSVVFITLD